MTRTSAATSCRNPVVAVALLGVACAHPSEAPRWARLGQSCPADAPVVEVPVTLRDSVRGLWASFRDDDDRWADLAREVPGGFAGMMLEGGLVVFLVGPRHAPAALGALAARGPLGARTPGRAAVGNAGGDSSHRLTCYNY